MPQQIRKTLVLMIYFILTVSTLLVFWQVRNFDFIGYDDNNYVYENPHVLNGLTFDNIIWAFTTGHAANWHPLTWLSLMLDRQLFGPGPAGFHLTNLFFHIANTLLLFLVLKQMTNEIWQSAFVAALFALHPMHVESVAWVAERKDVLSTFFWLLTMWAYLRYVKQPNIWRYLLVLLFFVMGIMAKPMLVTLPFVLLLLDYWPLGRISRFNRQIFYRLVLSAGHLMVEKIPFFVLSAISSVITFLVQRNAGAVTDIDILSLNNRIANALLSYAEYMGKMLWPINLAVFYPFNAAASSPSCRPAACALLLLGISVFVIYLGRNQRYLFLGWFWFVGTLTPVIGIIQVGQQAYADRYTYIPYIGLFIMLAWGLTQLLSKLIYRKIVLGVSMVIILTPLGICAHRQTSYWKNDITLFSHANQVTQNNYIAYNDIGNAYVKLGRNIEAVDAYKQAIIFNPNYAIMHYNLGLSYSNLGRNTEAIEAYKLAIRVKPDYTQAYYNLGVAYAGLGRSTEAIDAFKQVIRIKPDYARAYYNLGVAYAGLGRSTDAIDAFKQVIRIKPDYAMAYNNLGVVYGKLGRLPEAIEAFKQAIKLKPDYVDACNNLGVAYLAIGDKNSALVEYNILKSLNSEMANNLLNKINK